MNRLQTPHVDQAASDSRRGPSGLPATRLTFQAAVARTSLFAPIHYEANYAYPLIVWLHDSDSTERQLRDVMPGISLRNYVGVAVRGTPVADRHSCDVQPFDSTSDDISHVESRASRGIGYGWTQSPDGIELAGELVAQSVAMAQSKFHVDPRRVFLVGAGEGGTMALRLALQLPTEFAGVASLGGVFPFGGLPFASISAVRQQIRVLLTQCRDDFAYPTERLCDDLRLLHSAGIDVTVRQYPSKDYLTRSQLTDVDAWVMAQLAGDPQDIKPATRHDNPSRN